MTHADLTIEADSHAQAAESYQAALAWALLHAPTREAYKRCTGEEVAPVIDRYREWLEANLIGRPDDVTDEAEAAA